MTARNYVVELLHDSRCTGDWALSDWDLLIRQARSADLLGRIAENLSIEGLLVNVPQAPRMHLESARILFAAQSRAVKREVAHIVNALALLNIDVILLKGAAYLMAGLPASCGRMFTDVDILVPRERLPEVESELMLHGWIGSHRHPYDQRYYREWMHEIPPMQHIDRQTVIDVHHAIVPATARIKSDASAIIEAALPIEGMQGIRVLAPADMVLHSATHLFFNEEFSHGLRDLSDMDLLLRHFGTEETFWNALVERAKQLNLERPLYYCLRHTVRVFGTPVPDDVQRTSRSSASAGWFIGSLMDRLWRAALQPPHASLSEPYDALAGSLLYFRSHWQKMPPHLLAYHLLHKVFRSKPDVNSESPRV